MSEIIRSEHWKALRATIGYNPFVKDSLSEEISRVGCSIGLDDESRLHLLIRISDPKGDLPPDLNDITIRYVQFDELYVDVSANATLELFVTPVFEAIISGCLDGRAVLTVVGEELERIRKAFTRVNSELSENKQIGIVGELMVLRYVLIPTIGSRAVLLWSGPFGERHDFSGSKVHLEVKATTKSVDQHEISRIDQLRAPEGKQLLLASVQLERSIAGTETIATLLSAIMNELGQDGPALAAFEARLREVGWQDRLIQTGTLLKFNRRSLSFFAVEGEFPRMPDDYVPPRGIVALNYTINVSSCPVLAPSKVRELISGM